MSCTAWGFSCLANYSASGELLPRLFTLTFPLLPKNRRCLFCDTFRRRNFATATPAHSTRHAAVWCSDFPPANLAIHQRSSAIVEELSIIRASRKPIESAPSAYGFWLSCVWARDCSVTSRARSSERFIQLCSDAWPRGAGVNGEAAGFADCVVTDCAIAGGVSFCLCRKKKNPKPATMAKMRKARIPCFLEQLPSQ